MQYSPDASIGTDIPRRKSTKASGIRSIFSLGSENHTLSHRIFAPLPFIESAIESVNDRRKKRRRKKRESMVIEEDGVEVRIKIT